MQRSIGKKILAVVAGIGISLSGMALVTSPAAAEDVECGSEVGINEEVNVALQIALTAVTAQCEAAAPNKRYEYQVVSQVVELDTSGKPTGRQKVGVVGTYWNDPRPDELPDCVGDLCEIIEDALEDAYEPLPPPPPCWSNNNCPVGGAIQVAVPDYMIAGVPQTLVVYAAWRPDENTPGAPTNGDAVISMDGAPVAAAPFVDGVATLKFTPKVPGLKEAKISGVLNSNTSGANAWIDSVEDSTMVLPYDPELLEEALKNKKVEVGQTYTLEEVAQAKTALGKRLEWRVAQDSKDVCAVTTTKKGEVKAKFTESGKCSIIWTDPKTDEEGKYTFKVTA